MVVAMDDAQRLADWQQQLEEVTALQAICGDDFAVLSEGLDDAEAGFSDEVMSHLPAEPLECQAAVIVEVPPGGLVLEMEDSGNGDAAQAGPSVRHLPPLCLRLRFPSAYPSAQPPEVNLSALWLGAASSMLLHEKLLRQWEEQGTGLPIVYQWIDWLQQSALEAIGAGSALRLHSVSAPQPVSQPAPSSSNGRTSQITASAHSSQQIAAAAWHVQQQAHKDGLRDSNFNGAAQAHPSEQNGQAALAPSVDYAAYARTPEQLAVQLMRFDAARDYSLFQQGTWQCSVCFEEKPGSQCIRIDDCKHIFCEECLTTNCRMHVTEGSLDQLKCLDPGCGVRLSPQLLGRLLSQEEMERIEQLTLQRALDCMVDLMHCPRCSSPAVEDADHCVQCPKCMFVFCSLCNAGWHPGVQCMSPETQLELLRQRMAGRKDGVEELQRREQECLSLTTIKETAKQCPCCAMATQKTEGCSKMTCTNCRAYWCWKCNKVISGYDHFQSGACVLFDDEEIRRWNAQWDAQMVRQEALAAQQQYWPEENGGGGGVIHVRHSCPTCGAANIKFQHNNHITCWSCTSPFCALCRRSLRGVGGKHFGGKGKCRQHTRD